jgi:hypothetical protein
VLLLGLGLAAAPLAPLHAANYLLWDTEHHRVDAHIQTWDTLQVLGRIAASTRWQIYVQPDSRQVLPTRFRNLSEGDALRRLLGDLNYVQVRQTNGVPRLYVFRTTRDDATELVRAVEGEAKAGPIEDEWVVRLKPGESIEELAKRLGATVVGRLEGLNAYRLKFPDATKARLARESLLKEPGVGSVDNNYNVPRDDSPESLALSRPPFTLQPKVPADGKYVIVGLIDSAVQSSASRYGDLMLDPISVASGTQATSDQLSHGSAMAETVLNGLAATLDKNSATSVRVLPVDVYGGNAATTTFDTALGIFKAVEAGAKIINLSMGSDGDSALLRDVITSSHQQGVIFFAAAGNEPVTTPVYPAAYPETTAVTAVDRAGDIASYANRGSFVEAGGPSTVLVTFNGQTYAITGTSGATAYVSGVAAGLIEKTGRPPLQVQKAIPNLMPVRRP